jgi:hypothetical protein
MKTYSSLRALLALTLLTSAGSLSAQSDRAAAEVGDATAASAETISLSDPTKPGTLRIDIPWADVKITGSDNSAISVQSSLTNKNRKVERGGLRRLDDQVSFELVEKDNVVVLALVGEGARGARDAEFEITVPRQLSLDIKTNLGGEVKVTDVEGDITVESLNGDVTLTGLVGATVVNTMNSEIKVSYAKVPQKPISIASMNGEVALSVPSETKANVRLRSHHGSILTDFSEDMLKTKTEGRSADGFNSRDTESAQAAAREAAEAAKVAVRAAMEIAREVTAEVERAIKDKSDKSAPPAPKAPRTPRSHRAPMPPITGGKLVSGPLNGGGIDISISTMNGEITLRQTK